MMNVGPSLDTVTSSLCPPALCHHPGLWFPLEAFLPLLEETEAQRKQILSLKSHS